MHYNKLRSAISISNQHLKNYKSINSAATLTTSTNVVQFIVPSFRVNQSIQRNQNERSLSTSTKTKLDSDEQDIVTLHMVPRGKVIPSPSPFVMKLWTYLKMAEIPYKVSSKTPFGPKGKTPWITLNGQTVTDSQIIIEFLGKKFNKNFSKQYSPEEIAISSSVRIMLEEHFFWGGLALWRMREGRDTTEDVFKIPKSPFVKLFVNYWFAPKMNFYAWAQGLGRHNTEELYQMMKKDLEITSTILGNKRFILGDTPTENDCAIFGLMSQILWAMPNSSYSKLLNEELKNLRDYTLRMRELYWPDWESSLAKMKK